MGSYSAEEYFYKVDNMVHSSCQVLSKLFQTRWKRETGKPWEHTEKQGRQFIQGVGKNIFKKAYQIQKEWLAKGCLEEWDLSLLSMVLLNFGKPEEYETENEAVRKLTGMRNDLAHRTTKSKKLSQEQYDENVKLFRVILRALQVKNELIEKIVEKAGLTSSVSALDATKKLFEMGEKCMKAGYFEKAISCFDEATTMPSLLPVNQGTAFEKRAEYYLQLAHHKKQNQCKIDADKCCEQAFLDATEALGLNDNSWKAHHLLARCHRWQNHFDEAISHCQTALAISPAQKQVKAELDSCKTLSCWREGEETTDPRNLPVSLTEGLERLELETGYKLTEEEFINYKTAVEGKVFKGQANVFRGHQYKMGWSVPQNDEEAVRYFAKAAKEGNAEGIFNLGLCYRHGTGVKQDLSKAYELCLQAAQMPADIPGTPNHAKKNFGVVSAQHCVGAFYEYGIVVEEDPSEAALWYKKATENGDGTSAYNLGLMYAQGRGVPRNIKSAEMYWNQGVIFREPKAAEALMRYYIQQLEPERARNMFQTGRRLESVALNGIGEEEFNTMIQLATVHRKKFEADVLTYENQNKLSFKGMTFLERLHRYSFTLDENKAKLLKNPADVASNVGQNWGGRMKEWKYSDLDQMVKLIVDLVVKSMVATSNPSTLIGGKNHSNKEEKSNVPSSIISPLNPKTLPIQDDQALKPISILDKKQYLASPVRKLLIFEHRKEILKVSKIKLNPCGLFFYSKPPKLIQTTPKRISRVSPITLKDMNPTTDTIYEERIIGLTIVEDPCYDFNPNAIHIVAEDENGDLTRLYLYNIPHDKETKEKVKFGCRIAILNPYMRIGGLDGTNGIRNDEPKCVIYLGEVKNMCRFCGEENAANTCSKCKRASYCNRECQTLDWQMMKHKLICSTS